MEYKTNLELEEIFKNITYEDIEESYDDYTNYFNDFQYRGMRVSILTMLIIFKRFDILEIWKNQEKLTIIDILGQGNGQGGDDLLGIYFKATDTIILNFDLPFFWLFANLNIPNEPNDVFRFYDRDKNESFYKFRDLLGHKFMIDLLYELRFNITRYFIHIVPIGGEGGYNDIQFIIPDTILLKHYIQLPYTIQLCGDIISLLNDCVDKLPDSNLTMSERIRIWRYIENFYEFLSTIIENDKLNIDAFLKLEPFINKLFSNRKIQDLETYSHILFDQISVIDSLVIFKNQLDFTREHQEAVYNIYNIFFSYRYSNINFNTTSDFFNDDYILELIKGYLYLSYISPDYYKPKDVNNCIENIYRRNLPKVPYTNIQRDLLTIGIPKKDVYTFFEDVCREFKSISDAFFQMKINFIDFTNTFISIPEFDNDYFTMNSIYYLDGLKSYTNIFNIDTNEKNVKHQVDVFIQKFFSNNETIDLDTLLIYTVSAFGVIGDIKQLYSPTKLEFIYKVINRITCELFIENKIKLFTQNTVKNVKDFIKYFPYHIDKDKDNILIGIDQYFKIYMVTLLYISILSVDKRDLLIGNGKNVYPQRDKKIMKSIYKRVVTFMKTNLENIKETYYDTNKIDSFNNDETNVKLLVSDDVLPLYGIDLKAFGITDDVLIDMILNEPDKFRKNMLWDIYHVSKLSQLLGLEGIIGDKRHLMKNRQLIKHTLNIQVNQEIPNDCILQILRDNKPPDWWIKFWIERLEYTSKPDISTFLINLNK